MSPRAPARGHVAERAHDDAVAGFEQSVWLGTAAERIAAASLASPNPALHVAVGTIITFSGLSPVDDPGAMRGGDRLGDLVPTVTACRTSSGPRSTPAQRDAVDVFGGQELHPAVVADVVHGQDVG